MRLAATGSLISRKDVIVIASVSCIYGLGSPDDFRALSIEIECGKEFGRDCLLEKLIDCLYNRNGVELRPGKFRVRGDVVMYFLLCKQPSTNRVLGEEIEAIQEIDGLTGETLHSLDSYKIYPANQYITTKDKLKSPAVK